MFHYHVYFKTKQRYIPAMVIDLAVRQNHLLEVFAETAEAVEVMPGEYFEHMTE